MKDLNEQKQVVGIRGRTLSEHHLTRYFSALFNPPSYRWAKQHLQLRSGWFIAIPPTKFCSTAGFFKKEGFAVGAMRKDYYICPRQKRKVKLAIPRIKARMPSASYSIRSSESQEARQLLLHTSTMNTLFPACFVEMPASTEHRRAPFYLAAEEYIAHRFPTGNYLFSWQLAPTVVMGRHQIAHQEVDLDYCRAEGIDVVRRKSGGGAIFADEGNIMWSLIAEEGSVEPLFQAYAQRVAEALGQLGAEVKVTGRNDLTLAQGGKICGNAFYHLPHRNIIHGTMLYDTDPPRMQAALHPEESKLTSKGVASVRSRIALLKEHLSFGVSELRRRLRPLLCDRTLTLQADDVCAIEEIERSYYDPAYLYGQSLRHTLTRQARFEGCGTIAVQLALQGSLIGSIQLNGDFFELGSATESFQLAFENQPYTRQSLEKAVAEKHPERSIRGLSAADLLSLLLPETNRL